MLTPVGCCFGLGLFVVIWVVLAEFGLMVLICCFGLVGLLIMYWFAWLECLRIGWVCFSFLFRCLFALCLFSLFCYSYLFLILKFYYFGLC